MPNPYVLTDDLRTVFTAMDTDCCPRALESALDKASDRITASLQEIYQDVERIPSSRMSLFLQKGITATEAPIISLVPLMNNSDYPNAQIETIESSRTVKPVVQQNGLIAFEDVGSMPRHSNAPALKEQFKTAANNIDGAASHVHLVDDVVFTGGTIITLSQQLAEQGITLDTVIANVAIQEGIDRLKQHRITVEADLVYTKVIDEVCMRDFIVGAPAGGRNLLMDDGSYASVPYLSPFGMAESWGSIKAGHVSEFSKACLEASLNIWEVIGASVTFKELPKSIFGCNPEDSIASTIKQLLSEQAYEQRPNSNTLRL